MMDSSAASTEAMTLSRLVSELSLDERNNFLEKIRGQSTLSFEPLYVHDEDTERGEIFDEHYTRLPWYTRLRYFLMSLLKSKPPVKVFEDGQINKMGRKIEAKASGLYDYQRNLLLLGFFDLVTDLKAAARFFFTALDVSVNRDKSGFYAFLGSLEMGGVHRRLETETMPELFTDRTDVSERELRQSALKSMDDIFSTISDAQRGAMYYNARSLNCLKELSAFGFDRLLMSFGSSGGQTCPVNPVRDLLFSLNNILFSLKDPPTLSLLESLFVYRLQERSGEPGFNMNNELHDLLARAEEAITTIREFNKQVPLTKILRCGCRDMSISPQQISGGEDWFTIYRDFWKKRVETKVVNYIRKRKQWELTSLFRHFLKGTNLRVLTHVVSEVNPRGVPVPEAFTLSFLLTFYAAVFSNDLNTYLRPILIDGEFFKKENRAEYTGAYDDIMKIEADIHTFDAKLAPTGEYGSRYDQVRDEIVSLPVKRRKTQMVLDDVSRDAKGIIKRARESMTCLINVLNGILKKEPGSKYDSIANFDKLAGKTPEVFTEGIVETIKQLRQTLDILKEIDSLGHLQ